MEFNPDGSIKLPEHVQKKKKQDNFRLTQAHCIQVKKDVVSFSAPKKCVLHVRLSDKLMDDGFVDSIHKRFNSTAEVPTKIQKVKDKEFDIEIGTCFRRCSDCTKLIGMFKEHVAGNIIENKGNCTYERPQQNFCHEDHFE